MKSTANIPIPGLKGLKTTWKDDLISGFSVSLIALPLCLGISIASGFPPLAGLITAIIGGILSSRISGSHVTIYGPAAGLIVISLGAVESLGNGNHELGYPFALAAIFVAGLLMTIFGFLKVGKYGDFFPSAVVHGMLAAIGVIIMVKQSFVALGIPSIKGEIMEAIIGLPKAALHTNPAVLLISLTSLLLLIVHPRVRNRFIKMIPAPMWVLMVTIPMARFLNLGVEHTYSFMGKSFMLGPNYLVQLPKSVLDGITFPDFSKILNGAFWIAVISFALVSTIESMLSAKAVDALDHFQRKSNLNKDVSAIGVGSSIAGLLGGLPMIAEIVRSSANINNGGKTQWANFFHGSFLLIFVLFGTFIIEQIPLAALASMLVFTGFRLASPKEFKHMLEVGRAQLAVFLVTLIVVLLTDLLIGVAAGILFKIGIHTIYGTSLKNVFKIESQTEILENKSVKISLKGSAIFSNYLALKKIILKQASSAQDIVVDFSECRLVDHSSMNNIKSLEKDLHEQKKSLICIGLGHLNQVSAHPLSARLQQEKGSIFSTFKTSNRQQLMLDFASKYEMEYTIQQIKDIERWKAFDFMKSTRVESVKNRLTGFLTHSVIQIADVVFVEGALMSEKTHKITLLKMKPELQHFPSFTLEKEQFFEKIVAGWKDINFDSHPVFSEYYYLKSEEEQEVRAFFTEELLTFFEQHQGFHLESDGKHLIIYELDGLLSKEKLSSIYELAKGLDELLHKNYK